MAVTVYAIIGDANTRKSSTARALTGVGQKKKVDIESMAGTLPAFVQISALQESAIAPNEFINHMTTDGHLNAVVTLRDAPLSKGGHTFPSGSAYLREFINAGWRIQQVVVLGAPRLAHALPAGTPGPMYVPGSRSTPTNKIASQIRQSWAWL